MYKLYATTNAGYTWVNTMREPHPPFRKLLDTIPPAPPHTTIHVVDGALVAKYAEWKPTTVEVRRAQGFATDAHGGQKYGLYSYTKHLNDVVSVLEEFGYDSPEMLVLGWLHDVLEDTSTTVEDLSSEFGGTVALQVAALTTYGTRRERLGQLQTQLAQNPEVLPVKLADRIANVRECWRTQNSRLLMYVKEYLEFRKLVELDQSALIEDMWQALDKLHGRV